MTIVPESAAVGVNEIPTPLRFHSYLSQQRTSEPLMHLDITRYADQDCTAATLDGYALRLVNTGDKMSPGDKTGDNLNLSPSVDFDASVDEPLHVSY